MLSVFYLLNLFLLSSYLKLNIQVPTYFYTMVETPVIFSVDKQRVYIAQLLRININCQEKDGVKK